MRGSGKAEQPNGGPLRIERVDDEDGSYSASADEHGSEARSDGGEAEFAERHGQPSAADAADGRSSVDDDEREAHVLQVEAVLFAEEIRQPEEEEPPDGIGETFTNGKGPCLAIGEQTHPRDRRAHLCGGFFIDEAQLRAGQRGVVLWFSIFAVT